MISKSGFSRSRFIHCTLDVLTPAISPDMGILGCMICGRRGLRLRFFLINLAC